MACLNVVIQPSRQVVYENGVDTGEMVPSTSYDVWFADGSDHPEGWTFFDDEWQPTSAIGVATYGDPMFGRLSAGSRRQGAA